MQKEEEKILRATEQCLCHLGILTASDCRAKGGAPKKLITALAIEIADLLEELQDVYHKIVYEKNDKVYYSANYLEKYEETLWLDLQQTLNDYIDKALEFGINDAADDLGVKIGFEAIDKQIISILEEQELVLSQTTASKIFGNIKQTILESQRLGDNLEQTIQKLQSISTLSHYEAERIARTELSKAANIARLQGYKGRINKVEWVLGPAYNGICACGNYAGVHTIEEAETLPMSTVHPNCDCFWSPVID